MQIFSLSNRVTTSAGGLPSLLSRSAVAVAIAGLLLLSPVQAARATDLTFNIDSAQSYITLSVETEDGTQISSAQTPGSDTTNLFGTLSVDLTSSSIQFLPTSDTHFAAQALAQSPLADGSLGTAPADYGLALSIPGVGGGVAAGRDYLADTTSAAIPLAGTSFDASQLSVNTPAGNTAYNLTLLGTPLQGSIGPGIPVFNSLTDGTLTRSGDIYTITVPILASGGFRVGGVSLVDVFAGQLVATAVVPEPASIVLAAAAGLLLLPLLRYSSRRPRTTPHD